MAVFFSLLFSNLALHKGIYVKYITDYLDIPMANAALRKFSSKLIFLLVNILPKGQAHRLHSHLVNEQGTTGPSQSSAQDVFSNVL